jgi:uncharacterized protein (TIGR03086 family)
MTMDTLELLDGAYASSGRIIAKVTADQLSAPTPCRDWDVRTVLNHTTGVIGGFVATAAGQRSERLDQKDWIGSDPSASYQDTTRANLAAWSAPGALEGTCVLPIGLELPAPVAAGINFIDALVHGWDLATAVHLDATLDPELATAALEIAKMVIRDDFRGPGKGFGYVVEAPAGASPTDQLVTFMGRQP